MIGRENRSTRRKPASEPLCPPRTLHVARTRIRAAEVRSQRLTAWATSRPSPLKVNRLFGGRYLFSLSKVFTVGFCSADSSTLKMEAICFPKTSVEFQHTSMRYIQNHTLTVRGFECCEMSCNYDDQTKEGEYRGTCSTNGRAE
jgi:hypothetical protein